MTNRVSIAGIINTSTRRGLALLTLLSLAWVAPAAHGQFPDENDALERATQRMREAVQRVVVPPTSLTDGPYVRAAFKEVVAGPNAWTVRIKCKGTNVALGTIVSPTGHVLTKASQLSDNLTCRLHDGRELPGQLIGENKEYDLAMLKIDADGLPVVHWEDSPANLGQWLATPGQGAEPAAIGVLSVLQRAIPKESGFLGIVLDEGKGGPRVTQVMPESGAAAAGVLIEDIVTHCNGIRTDNRQKLIMTVRKFGPGEEVKLTILRGDKEVSLLAMLSRSVQGWQPDRREVQNTMGGKLSDRRQGFPAALQHDTVLQPADCGGVVVNLDGRAVGVNVARAGRTESFAVPAATVRALLPELMAGNLTQVSAETTPEPAPAVESPARPAVEEGTPPEPNVE